MFRWIPYAFIRITVALIAGILSGVYFPELISVRVVQITVVVIFLLFVGLVFFSSSREKIISGVVGLFLFFVIGYGDVRYRNESLRSDHLLHVNSPIHYYTVTITSFPEEKNKSWREVAEVNRIKTDSGWEQASGKVQLYFNKEDFNDPFQYGDVLLIKGSPIILSPPQNPNEFDYKRFLSFQNIYYQDFLKRAKVQFITNNPPSDLINMAMTARSSGFATIRKYVTGKREQAIVAAIVLGIKDGLDDELISAYSASGAMHVLAVSGLHVGVIYWIVLLLLRPLNRIRRGKWLIAGISIAVLWCYVFVTGVSPSVLRAATMFSFIAIAKPWHRRTNIYNTLAASAFFLLLYNPFLIMSVGFQLSYLAVLGIVYLYPRLIVLWSPTSWILVQSWKIIVVSISAQLATFSVGLLYFHQFPIYFLISNLFVIPLSFAVLVMGVVMILLSVVPALSFVLGMLLTWIVRILNAGLFVTESLPFSLARNIYITTFQCWLLLAFVVVILLLFATRKFNLIYVSLAIVLLFSGVEWYQYRQSTAGTRFTIYSISGHSAMELFENGESYFFSDSALAEDEGGLRFHIISNRVARHVKRTNHGDDQVFVRDINGCRLIALGNITLFQLTDDQFDGGSRFSVDYLIVSNNAIHDLDELRNKVNFKKIVFDGSNSNYLTNKLIEQAKEKKISAYNVLEQGAMEITI